MGNYGTHKTPLVKNWFACHQHFHAHFTPTFFSWLDQVERWLATPAERQIRSGTHRRAAELEQAIRQRLAPDSRSPKPFVWTKTTDEIFESIKRFCIRTSNQGHLFVEIAMTDLQKARFDMAGSTLIKRAIIITGTDLGTIRGDLLLRGGKIVDVAPTLDVADAEVIDATRYIVCTGFIDPHRHLWQSLYKGLVYDLSMYDIFAKVYGAYSLRFNAEDIYNGTLLGRLTALDAGITTLLDWSHNVTTPAMADAGIQALKDSGGRSIFGHGYPGDRTVPSELPRYHNVPRSFEGAERIRKLLPDDEALVSSCYLGLEPGWFISLEACKKEFEIARDLGMRISIHIASLDANFKPFASIEAMHGVGIMRDDVTYLHLMHATDHELQLIAETDGTASVSPQVDAHIFAPPPTGRLLATGVRPSLSLDSASCGSEDFFSQMRAAFDVERTLYRAGFQSRPKGYELTLNDVFEFATLQGARAIGQEHRLGSIAPGKMADLLFIDTSTPNMMPVLDPVASLVFHATVSDIDTVLVGGTPVKRGGRLLADMSKVRRQVEESVTRLFWNSRKDLPEWAYRPPVFELGGGETRQ